MHTVEHQYVYVAMLKKNQQFVLGITCSESSRVWKDLMTLKKPCCGIFILDWHNEEIYLVLTVRSEYT